MTRHTHSTHPALARRLRRAQGHLAKVVAMIDSQQECVDIAQQLHAVERAIVTAKRALIHDHIDHCLDSSQRRNAHGHAHSLDEFKQITKYL